MITETNKNKVIDYLYNIMNQLVSKSTNGDVSTFTYDKRGNLIREDTKNKSLTYEFDATNHMVKGVNENGDTSLYTYNALFLRINNTQVSHSGKSYSRDYVIDYNSKDKNNDLMVYADGEYVQSNVYRGDERVAQITNKASNGQERLFYVHEDVRGTTRRYTKADGQNFEELFYDAWGLPISPNKLINNDHGNFVAANFTGHKFDVILDMYFAQARFYDAGNRTFISRDPAKDGLNWYKYVANNPKTFVDPMGLWYVNEEKSSDTDKEDTVWDKVGKVLTYVFLWPLMLSGCSAQDNTSPTSTQTPTSTPSPSPKPTPTSNSEKVYAHVSTDTDRLSDDEQKSNAEYINNYLDEEGWSKEAISATLGNIERESHFNPGVWQNLNNTTQGGYGLVQWDPATKFLSYFENFSCEDANTLADGSTADKKNLMDKQLEYLVASASAPAGSDVRQWFEGSARANGYTGERTYSFEQFKQGYLDKPGNTTVSELAKVFETHYERASAKAFDERTSNAEKWYEYFKDR